MVSEPSRPSGLTTSCSPSQVHPHGASGWTQARHCVEAWLWSCMGMGIAKLQQLRWDDLRVFLAIARGGSLGAAGEQLAVNTSTVQRRLSALERSLGTRLFDRDPTGSAPTAAGDALLPLAEQVEADVMAVVRSIAGRDQSPRGPVHLTAAEPLLTLMVEPLAAFRLEFPAIDLRVSFSDRFYDLSRREADVAVRPSPEPPEDAVGRRVATVAWAVYVGTSAQGAPADLPWARFSDDLARLAAARWWRARCGGEPVLLSVNSVPAMHRVVACSPCRALLPCFVGDADPTLRRVGPPIPEAASALWLLLHPDLRRAARVRALADHLWDALVEVRPLLEGDWPSHS